MSEALEERQRNEVSALQAIFADDFDDVLSPADGDESVVPPAISRPDFKLFLRPKRNTGHSFNSVNATLHIRFSRDYPDIIPEITIEDVHGVKEETIKDLHKHLVQLANKNRGQEMCLVLADYVQEFLHQHMVRVFGSFYEEMLFRKQEQSTEEELQQRQFLKTEDDQFAREYELLEHELRQMRDMRSTHPRDLDDAGNTLAAEVSVRDDLLPRRSSRVRFQDDEDADDQTSDVVCIESISITTSVAGQQRPKAKSSKRMSERILSPPEMDAIREDENELDEISRSTSSDHSTSGDGVIDDADFTNFAADNAADVIRFSTKNGRPLTFVRISSAAAPHKSKPAKSEQQNATFSAQPRTSRHQKKTESVRQHDADDEPNYFRRAVSQVFSLQNHGIYTMKEWTLDISGVSSLILQQNTETSSSSRSNVGGRHNKLRERESLRQLQQVLFKRLEALAHEYRQLHNALQNFSSTSLLKYHHFDYADDAVPSKKPSISSSSPQNLKIRLLTDNILVAKNAEGRAFSAVTLHQLLLHPGTSLSLSFVQKVARQCLFSLRLLHEAHLAYGNLRPDAVQILFPTDDDDDEIENAFNESRDTVSIRLSCYAVERRLEQLFHTIVQQRYAAVVNLEQEIDQELQRQLAQTRASKKGDVHDLGRLMCWLIAASRNASSNEDRRIQPGVLTLKYFGPTNTAEDVFPVIPSNIPREWEQFIEKCLYPDRKIPVDSLVAKMLDDPLMKADATVDSSHRRPADAPDRRSPDKKPAIMSENSTWSCSLSSKHPQNTFKLGKPKQIDKVDDDGDDEQDETDTSKSASIIDELINPKSESRLHRDFVVLGTIGKGAYGAVVSVRNKLDNRPYAIKQIILPAASHARYAALQEKMIREVQLLSRLNHENVVRYYNSWLDYVEVTRSPKSLAVATPAANIQKDFAGSASATGRMVLGYQNNLPGDAGLQLPPAIHVDVLNSIGIVNDDNIEADAPPMPSFVSGFGSGDDNNVDNVSENDQSDSDDDDSLLLRGKKAGLSVKRIGRQATPSDRHGGGIFEESSFVYIEDDDEENSEVAAETDDEASEITNSSADGIVMPKRGQNDGTPVDGNYSDHTTINEQQVSADTVSSGPRTERISILYIQMEYCEQSTLRTLITHSGLFLDSERIWRLFREIVDGLSHIHAQGMIHRDLKPENIFISSSNHVKIGDFGLATNVAAAQQLEDGSSVVADMSSSSLDSGSNPTRPKLMHSAESMTGRIGTSYYIAPELVKGRAVYTNKVDIFSLGICFFEMCYRPLSTQMERAKILSGLRSDPIQFPPDWVDHSSTIDAESAANATPKQKQLMLIKKMCNAEPRKRPTAVEILQSELLPPAKLEEARAVDWLRQILHHSHMSMFAKIIHMLFERKCSLLQDVTYDSKELWATLVRKGGRLAGRNNSIINDVSPLVNVVISLATPSPMLNISALPAPSPAHPHWARSMSMTPTSNNANAMLLQQQQDQLLVEEKRLTLKVQYIIFDNVISRIESLFRLFGGMRCDTPVFLPKANSTASGTDSRAKGNAEDFLRRPASSSSAAGAKQQQVVEFMNRAGSIVSPAFDARTPFARLIGRTGLSSLKRYAVHCGYRESADYVHPRRQLEAAFDIVLPQSLMAAGAGANSAESVICAQAELVSLLACVLREFRAFARTAASGSSSKFGSRNPSPVAASSSTSINRRRLLLLSHYSVFCALLRECSLPLEKAALVQDVVLDAFSFSHSNLTSETRKLNMQKKLLSVLYPNETEAALEASNCGHFCRLVETLQNKPIREVLTLVQSEFTRKGQQSFERREAERGIRECIDVINTAKVMCAAFNEDFLLIQFSVCLSDRNVLNTLTSGGIMFQAAIETSSSISSSTTTGVTSTTRLSMPASASSATLLQIRGAESTGKKIPQQSTAESKQRRTKRQVIAAGGRYDKLVERFRVSPRKQQEHRVSAACFGISFSLDAIAQAELDEFDADEQTLLAARQANAAVIVVNTGRAELAHSELSLVNEFRLRGVSCDRVMYNSLNTHIDGDYGFYSSTNVNTGSGDDDLADMCRAGSGGATKASGKTLFNADRNSIGSLSGVAFVQLHDTTTARLVHRLAGSAQRVADQKVALTEVVRRVVDKCLIPLLTGGGSNPLTSTNNEDPSSMPSSGSDAENYTSSVTSMVAQRLGAAAEYNNNVTFAGAAVHQQQQLDGGQIISTSSNSARVNITFSLPGAPAGGSSNLASKQQRYSSRDKRLFQTTIMNRLKHLFSMFSSQTSVEVVCVDLKEPLLHALVGSLYMTPEGRVQTLEGVAAGGTRNLKTSNNGGSGDHSFPVMLYEHSHAKHRAYLESIVATLKGLGENVRRRVIIYSLGGEGGIGPGTGPTLYRFVP